MKTTLLITLFAGALALAQAQDFRAVPPSEQPNAAELAYFGSKNPNAILEQQQDTESVSLVTGFLNDLVNGQWEAAHQRLARRFVAYGPGYNDSLETDNLLNQWERTGKSFTDQHLTIETTSTTVVPNGENRGKWVYVKGVWLAMDKAIPGKSIRIPFHQLTRINNGLIECICISYGAD